jgi:tetratricopeptide (TPR) repeat protein
MLAPNTILQSRYLIARQLGQGGMGTVYQATDERFKNFVAVKEARFPTIEVDRAFEREAHLLRSLKHPALPGVIDFFSENQTWYLVMDFVAGEDLAVSLAQRLESGDGPFAPGEVVRWGEQVLSALEFLHAHEPPILHRDIKPQNLKVTEQGKVMLLDFGLAKGSVEAVSRVVGGESVAGYTPYYAPLEQMQGSGTSERGDLFSVSATMYHLMTGVVPPDALTRAFRVLNGDPDPLLSADALNPSVPPGVAAVLGSAMALKQEERPASAVLLRQALRGASQQIFETGHGAATRTGNKPAAGYETVPGSGISGAVASFATVREQTIPLPPAPGPEMGRGRGRGWPVMQLGGVTVGLCVLLLGATLALLSSSEWSATKAEGPSDTTSTQEPDPIAVFEGELAGGETRDHEIALTEGQYLQITVEQGGVDLAVTSFGPDGKHLSEVNTLQSTRGVERVHLIAEVSGTYRLQVHPKGASAAAGRYELRIVPPRMATPRDGSRVAAQKAFTRGHELALEVEKDLSQDRANPTPAKFSLESAVGHYSEALQLWRATGERESEAITLHALGGMYNRLGESENELASNSQALALWQTLGDRRGEALALTRAATRCIRLGEMRKGLAHAEQALPLWQAVEDTWGEAATRHNMGVAYGSLGQAQTAINSYHQAALLWRAIGERENEAFAQLSIGILHSDPSECMKAFWAYMEAVKIYQALNDRGMEALTWDRLAELYERWDGYAQHVDRARERAAWLRSGARARSPELVIPL